MKDSEDPQERETNLEPIAMSPDSQYFLLARKDKENDCIMGAVSQLKRGADGLYEFIAITEL